MDTELTAEFTPSGSLIWKLPRIFPLRIVTHKMFWLGSSMQERFAVVPFTPVESEPRKTTPSP